jgi:hypothetical protein
MDRRKEPRLLIESPVHIRGVTEWHARLRRIVRLENVSFGGAVLLRIQLLGFAPAASWKHGSRRAQFRIVRASSERRALSDCPLNLASGTLPFPMMFDMVGAG